MEEGEDLELLFTMTDYLPYAYRNPADSDYFENLIDFSTKSLLDRDPHFSIAALHMVYMGAVYNYLYGLYRLSPKKFDSVLIGFHHLFPKYTGINSWQDFSLIHERSIFEFFRHVGLAESEIKEIKAPVKKRNDLLHANGFYVVDVDSFVEAAKIYLRCIEKIDRACFSVTKQLFFRFTRTVQVSLYDPEDAKDYLKNFFCAEYGVSKKSIGNLSKVSPSEYPAYPGSKKLRDGLKLITKEIRHS